MRQDLITAIVTTINAMAKTKDLGQRARLDKVLGKLYDSATLEEIAEANRRRVVLKY